jgi:outer membrane protein assembly factor BamB
MTQYLENTFYLLVEKIVNLKGKIAPGLLALLAVFILAIGLFGFSCVRGLSPIGWSGGTVANDTLYVGSIGGQLVAVNLNDNSVLPAQKLTPQSQPGLFGCSAAGGGCGGGSSRVPIYGTPVISDNLVYIAGYNGKVYAYRMDNLAQRWIYPREGYIPPIVGGMVLSQGKLYFGCSDGKVEGKKVKGVVFALDAETGDRLATFETDDRIWGTPAIDGSTLYIGSFDKNLYALNTGDLSLKWKYTTEGSIISTPLVYNGLVYFGSFDRNLYAVNASDGTLKWKFTGEKWFWARPVIVDSTIYAGCLDDFVYVLRADTGVKITEFDLGKPVPSQPAVIGSNIYFANSKGKIFSIDTGTNSISTLAETDTDVNGPLTAYNGMIYFQTQDLKLEQVNATSGAIAEISLSSG